MAESVPCAVCGAHFKPSDWSPWCSVACEAESVRAEEAAHCEAAEAVLRSALAEARAEGEAEGFRRGVAACVADVEGCLVFAAKAAQGPHNSERLRTHRHARAAVLGQVSYALRHLGGMGPRPEPEQD